MCGRYELSSHPAAIALAFGLAHVPDFAPRYNIAPMQRVPVVRQTANGERELVRLQWGFVPRFARDPSIGSRMINARAETLALRYAFRNAFARHRCLLPVNGFYEWQTTPRGKRPMHIGMPDGSPFGLAGLYERWLSPEGEVLDTCAIVTTAAPASLRAVHDRMPVIVPPAEYGRWLTPGANVRDLLAGWTDTLRIYAVSPRVNAVRNDDAALCEPVSSDESGDALDDAASAHGEPMHPARSSELAPEHADEEDAPVQASLF